MFKRFMLMSLILHLCIITACSQDEESTKLDPLLYGTWRTAPDDDPGSSIIIKTLTIREQYSTLNLKDTYQNITLSCTTEYEHYGDDKTITMTIISRICDDEYDSNAVGDVSTYEYQVDETSLVVIEVEDKSVGEYVRISY